MSSLNVGPRSDRAAARLAAEMVSYALGVAAEEIVGATRGSAEAAYARQIAMYLAHVAFEMSLNRVAIAFNRDRSTVAHACHLVEDRRDDPDLDALLERLEQALKEAPAPCRLPAPRERAR